MRLIAEWGVTSARLDRLLERGCLACAGEFGRLVQHPVPTGTQVWLSCVSCGARLEGPLPHPQHVKFPLYPRWRDGGCAYLLPEEIEQTTPARSLTFLEVVHAVFEGAHPILARAHAAARNDGMVVATGFVDPEDLLPACPSILAACGPPVFVTAEFGDEGRLLSVEPGLIRMLAPRRVGQRVEWGRAWVVG